MLFILIYSCSPQDFLKIIRVDIANARAKCWYHVMKIACLGSAWQTQCVKANTNICTLCPARLLNQALQLMVAPSRTRGHGTGPLENPTCGS